MVTLRPAGFGAAAMALAALAPALAAQQLEGDQAWNQGRFEAARSAYEKVLAGDSSAFRANLRLGVMLSWEGRQDSALVFLARARQSEPKDLEARLIEAKVMAWARRHRAAIERYDSVLAERPGLVEAELGRARARAWSGDLRAAEGGYRAVLASEPRNTDALVGLGYVYHWQGREGAAAHLAADALAADPGNHDARELREAIRAVVRPATELSTGWSNDSDRNTTFWQSLLASAPVAAGWRVIAEAGALEASDPARDAGRVGGELGLGWAVGAVRLTGAAGARRLLPDSAPDRTTETYRARLAWRPVSRLGLSAGYARHPFDEITALIERGLTLESLDAGLETTIARGLSIYGSGGAVWLSDGNHRTDAALGVLQTIYRGLFVGAYGRSLAYERRGEGYFSPDRFRLLEGTAGYTLDSGRWSGRLSGGLGAQQIGRGGASQTEWHLDARLGRQWGTGNRFDVFGAVTNSAVSSTTGAFRYRTAGVSLRLGL